jgi:hypothetical protein
VSRTVKVNTIYCVFISLNDTINTVTFWIKDIAIESKAVISLLIVGWNRCSKSKSRYLLVVVVVLQDIANASDCVEVLVLL